MEIPVVNRVIRVSLLIAIAAFATISTSCQQTGGDGAAADSTATDTTAHERSVGYASSRELVRVQFDDVPPPRGFFYRNHRNESFSYIFGGSRIGRFVYWGSGKESDVIAQYLEMMPKDPYNWTLERAPTAGSGEPLIFVKSGQVCRIRFSRPPRLGNGEFLVTISVESTPFDEHKKT